MNSADDFGSTRGITVLGLLEQLAAHARLLLGSAAVTGLAAGLLAFTSPRQFVASASFIPESGGESTAGLAAAARQFGIGLGGSAGSGWPAGLYVQVLTSQAMMTSLASDSIAHPDEPARRVALVDLFEMADGPAEVRAEKLVKLLRREVISVSESRLVGSVTLRVKTRWPEASKALAEQMMQRVDEFNHQARLETAQAELTFIDGRVDSARAALAASESRLATFLTANRAVNEPRLQFQRDQLERDLRFHEQLLLGLAQQREEARLRRARDVPSFTVVEHPRAPAVGEPRGTVARTVLGGAVGFLTAFGLIVLWQSLRQAMESDPAAAGRLRAALSRTLGRS